MKISSLIGEELDRYVAKALGIKLVFIKGNEIYAEGWYLDQSHCSGDKDSDPIPRYSRDWALGGPIIESEKIEIVWPKMDACCARYVWPKVTSVTFGSPTPLIAAMRCFVLNKLDGFDNE